MRRRARGGTARTRPPSPTRSPETGSRCLPGRRASRSLHGAVSLARHSLKQYLYHYARICEADGRGRRLDEETKGAVRAVQEQSSSQRHVLSSQVAPRRLAREWTESDD